MLTSNIRETELEIRLKTANLYPIYIRRWRKLLFLRWLCVTASENGHHKLCIDIAQQLADECGLVDNSIRNRDNSAQVSHLHKLQQQARGWRPCQSNIILWWAGDELDPFPFLPLSLFLPFCILSPSPSPSPPLPYPSPFPPFSFPTLFLSYHSRFIPFFFPTLPSPLSKPILTCFSPSSPSFYPFPSYPFPFLILSLSYPFPFPFSSPLSNLTPFVLSTSPMVLLPEYTVCGIVTMFKLAQKIATCSLLRRDYDETY